MGIKLPGIGDIGKTAVIRYDSRNLAEARVFYEDYFLCTAVSPEISGYTVNLKDIVSAKKNGNVR